MYHHENMIVLFFFRDEKQHIKIPWNIDEAKQLGIILNRYKLDHYYQVMIGVFIVYILYPFLSIIMN